MISLSGIVLMLCSNVKRVGAFDCDWGDWPARVGRILQSGGLKMRLKKKIHVGSGLDSSSKVWVITGTLLFSLSS